MKLATLCYIQKNGQTLMLHRVKKENDMHEGRWVTIGGKFELGEAPEECVIREVKEECGLEIKNPTLKGLLTFPAGNIGDESWYVFVFTTNEFSGQVIESNEGNLEWVDDDKLLNLNMWEGDKIFMQWLKKDGFFSGKFVYQEGKLTDHSVMFHLSKER